MVSRAGNSPVNCKKSAQEIQQLVDLAHEVHDNKVLDDLGIKQWLMFGSLWGIKKKLYNPLPWDDDVDMGVSGDDVHYQSLVSGEISLRFHNQGFYVKRASGSKWYCWYIQSKHMSFSVGLISSYFMITEVL